MTELPEVEVIRKDLEKGVVGKRFKHVEVASAALVPRHRNRPEFSRALEGRRIESVTRRGTRLVLGLDGGDALVVALGAHASLTRRTATEEPGRHTQVVATFTTGGALHYGQTGRDGELFVVDSASLRQLPELSPAGIDPLADTVTWPSFSEQLILRNTPLRALLVDDSFLVGLGEVYADEVLWAAGLSGERSSAGLSSQEVRRLYRAVQEVLHEAVRSVGDGGDGDGGDAERQGIHLQVHGLEGEPCPRCRTPLRHAEVAGGHRSFFCVQCQT